MAQGPGAFLALLLLPLASLHLPQSHSAWAGQAAPTYRASPIYRSFRCAVEDRNIELEEISFKPGNSGLELRAALNPRARPDSRCSGGYSGPDLQRLIRDPKWIPGFEVVGAVNGTVFRALERSYISNQLIWTAGKGLLAPLRRSGGNHLFVADARGGRDVALTFVTCTPRHKACARIRFPGEPVGKRAWAGGELLAELRRRFPTMTLAVQTNMPLMDSKSDPRGRLTHWSACPEKKPNDWRCSSVARTVLCAKRDGTLSLLTTPGAYPFDLAKGLRRGGTCHVDCEVFYNLDGGGSTQLAHLPTPPSQGQDATIDYELSGRRIETTQEQCSPYRPVDNYLIVVRPR